tara:strand:+ start:8807 stop:9796 length:990 start_codon:yes stop_codon:yes gene_type:complete
VKTPTIKAKIYTIGASFSYEKVKLPSLEVAYNSVPSQNISLNYTIDEIKSYWGSSLNIKQTKRDFSNTFIKNKKGVEQNIANIHPESENETSFSGSVFYSKSPFKMSIGLGSTLSKTLFPYQSLYFSSQYGFNHGINRLGIRLQKSYLENPENFFTNRINFKKISFPTKETRERIDLFWENIWTEKLKTKISFLGSWKPELIRSSQGGSFSLAFALKDNLSTLIRFKRITSIKKKEPLDNNGFFELDIISNQISYDLNFEWTIFGNYTLIREMRETIEVTQQASDEYLIGFKHNWTEHNISQAWQLSHIRGNMDDKSFSIQGKLQWTII